MSPKARSLLLSALLVALLALPATALATPMTVAQQGQASDAALHPQAGQVPHSTIVVDSGTDPDNSKSKTCLNSTPCTLRRAIVQARLAPASERPVQIHFNIPATPSEGYNSSLGVWEIEVMTTTDPSVFRTLEGGRIIVDGSTQPGGRGNGPKIILIGPGNGNKDGLIVGVNNSGSHDQNAIRGLAFQNFRTHMIVNSNNNLVEDNWFGLTANGAGVYLRRDDPQDGSGSGGVALSANVEDNLVRDNVFLGFDGVAAAFRGDGNIFTGNYVGTVANGTVPGKQTDPDLICTTVDWLGGGGLSLEGDNHRIEDNVIAGLRQEIFQASTQPDAIRAAGTGHLIQDNRIGRDSGNAEVGVCGRGIYLIGGPQDVRVLSNVVVNPGLSAISLNGQLYDANTLAGNVVKQRAAWTQVEGNPKAEDAIQLGPSLPSSLQNFQPAKVTQISGTSVSGTSGNGSPCPSCVVEIFLDDTDTIKEALQSLAVVTAGTNGNWSATLPFPLATGQGLRTTSTTARFNTIAGLSAGTTTGLSALYSQQKTIFLPQVVLD